MHLDQGVLTFIIAIGGFLGTVSLLVVNLKVSASMSALRTEMTHAISNLQSKFALDLKNVELQLANMRTDVANGRASLYESINSDARKLFMARETAEAMHRENVRRLDELVTQLASLSEKVG